MQPYLADTLTTEDDTLHEHTDDEWWTETV